VGSGTGLGLSITYGIIKEHQGTISVANRAGEGATFLIQLPLYAPTAEPERSVEGALL
jgi:signal transduction histidine kinase